MDIRYGLGFILALALVLAASSLFFRDREPERLKDPLELMTNPELGDKTKALETEAIPDERRVSEQTLDGELAAVNADETVEEPESNLESVFINLTQEMGKRGYAKELSDCIESQFRENQGIENPKDLDSMLKICDSLYKVAPQQSQQIREVVLQAIAKAQAKPEETERSIVQ